MWRSLCITPGSAILGNGPTDELAQWHLESEASIAPPFPMLEIQPSGPTSAPKLRRVLSAWDLIIYGIVAVTPSAPVTVYGEALVRSKGHAIDTILLAMVAMVLTAISYGRMAALYPSAGSAYSYVGHGLNPHLGFLAGWAMLLDYLFIPLFCVIYGSLALQRLLPTVPFFVFAAFFA